MDILTQAHVVLTEIFISVWRILANVHTNLTSPETRVHAYMLNILAADMDLPLLVFKQLFSKFAQKNSDVPACAKTEFNVKWPFKVIYWGHEKVMTK